MPDAGEVFADVGLQDINLVAPVALGNPQKMLRTKDGALGASAFAASERIGDEFTLEEWINEAHKGMMNHPVCEWRRLDHAHLRFEDGEFALLARCPCLPDQVILQVDQVLFEIAGEAHHLKAIPLSVARFLEGLVQIVEVDQLGP